MVCLRKPALVDSSLLFAGFAFDELDVPDMGIVLRSHDFLDITLVFEESLSEFV